MIANVTINRKVNTSETQFSFTDNNKVNQDQFWILKARIKAIKAYQIVSDLLLELK